MHVKACERPRNRNTGDFSRYRTGPPQENRLHQGLGYVCPNDEHEGRGRAIRKARQAGLEQARITRLAWHRNTRQHHPHTGPADVG